MADQGRKTHPRLLKLGQHERETLCLIARAGVVNLAGKRYITAIRAASRGAYGMGTISVLNTKVGYTALHDADYICLTDMARYRDAERTNYIIQNWMRNRNTP